MNRFDVHIQTVVALFGLGEVHQITPLQPGFVAHAHRVQTTTHDIMLKTYDRTRAITARMLEYVPFYAEVTDYLVQHTPVGDRIVAPLRRRNGMFVYDDDPYVSVVFPFIQGITPRENPLTTTQRCDIATTVAHIHRTSATVPLPTVARIETFAPRWDETWAALLDAEWYRIPTSVQALIAPVRRQLVTLQQRMRHVGAYLRMQPLPLVLCHSDIHGWNVIVRGERTWLIDFEGLVMAPAEQDLFFWYESPDWLEIFATYQRVVGGHTLNAQAMYFYQVKRYIEDIYEWVVELCDQQLDSARRSEYMRLLQATLADCTHMINITGHAV